MAKPVTEKFEELVLDVEFDPVGNPGVYTRICGLLDATVTRTANVDTSEVPGDCDDESVPVSIEKQVRSLDVGVSGTGSWAQQSQGKLKNWFYSGTSLNARVRDTNAASGDTEVESGPALLTTLTNSRTKGQVVSAEVEIQFNGTPTRTAKA
ncbi:phage tail tube protein [Sinorhizobium meliloti]|uniref:phage tail tube protein n=1 Tax=Rhizobium meliloti TaxID=382 RepID=UPI000B499B33|nr:phage tail tube protein [Sinorhizobium meliloti]ASQ10640.1 hypothetical protein CDO22_10975 [Sinorhizobium meliloti]MQU81527.1 hypothetical protein [Sinorhizobium meliloti]MQU87245.1 hypothetical protein [Sinorhizobium meliloti]